MWGPPFPLAPQEEVFWPFAVPGGSGSCLSQDWGYCLCTGTGGHCLSLPFHLGANLGGGLEELGAEAPARMEVGLRFLAAQGKPG